MRRIRVRRYPGKRKLVRGYTRGVPKGYYIDANDTRTNAIFKKKLLAGRTIRGRGDPTYPIKDKRTNRIWGRSPAIKPKQRTIKINVGKRTMYAPIHR